MSLMEQVYRSYLQLQHPREIIMGSFMYMPFDGEDRALINRVINIVGAGLYPLALSLLIPVLLYALVLEKEEKLLLIMRMNGLSLLSYWLHFLMHSLALSLGTAAILYCTGRWLFAVPYFRDTEWQVLWSVFASWSVALTSLTAFAQMFV